MTRETIWILNFVVGLLCAYTASPYSPFPFSICAGLPFDPQPILLVLDSLGVTVAADTATVVAATLLAPAPGAPVNSPSAPAGALLGNLDAQCCFGICRCASSLPLDSLHHQNIKFIRHSKPLFIITCAIFFDVLKRCEVHLRTTFSWHVWNIYQVYRLSSRRCSPIFRSKICAGICSSGHCTVECKSVADGDTKAQVIGLLRSSVVRWSRWMQICSGDRNWRANLWVLPRPLRR